VVFEVTFGVIWRDLRAEGKSQMAKPLQSAEKGRPALAVRRASRGRAQSALRCSSSNAGAGEEDLSEETQQRAQDELNSGNITPNTAKRVFQRGACEDLNSADPAKGDAVKEAVGQIHNLREAEEDQVQKAFSLLQQHVDAPGLDLRGPRDVASDSAPPSEPTSNDDSQ